MKICLHFAFALRVTVYIIDQVPSNNRENHSTKFNFL